jgi:hypothetical protein
MVRFIKALLGCFARGCKIRGRHLIFEAGPVRALALRDGVAAVS